MKARAWIPPLLGVLLVQLVLITWIWRDTGEPPALPSSPLLQFDPDKITRIQISGGTNTLDIERDGTDWVLPGNYDFPAGAFQVDRLLDALDGLRPGVAVATTADAAKRFRVAPDDYERRIRLFVADQQLAELYVGEAAGPRRVYGRVGGQTLIYPLTFDAFQAETRPDAWTDKTWLHRDMGDIKAIALPGIALTRDGDGWQLAGLADGEQTDQEKADELVSRLADLNFMAVVGRTDEPPPGKPLFDAKLTLTGDKMVTYHFVDPGQGGDPLLSVSDGPFVFRIASFVVKPLHNARRDQLVIAEPAVLPVPPLQPQTDPDDVDITPVPATPPKETAEPAPLS